MIVLPSPHASSSTKIPHSESLPPSASLLPSLPPTDKPPIHPRLNDMPSASSSPSDRPKQRTLDEKTEIVALNMIILEPKEPDGYLLAGKLYEKQQRYTAARAIYAHSRHCVPHTHKRYDELRLGLKRIDTKRASFFRLLPYDVIDVIFSHLTSDDLLECANVSLSWNFFILQWPEFWDRLMGDGFSIAPAMAHSFLNVGKKEEERWRFYIQQPKINIDMLPDRPRRISNALLMSMLKFVTVPDASCNIREIYFERVILQRKHIDLLVEIVQSPNAKIESLSFNIVDLGIEYYALKLLLERCSQLKHFSLRDNWKNDYTMGRMDDRKPFMVPNIGYRTFSDDIPPYDTYMLTTLDLAMGHHGGYSQLTNLIKRCPYLKRLRIAFIDTSIFPGRVMRFAVDHCPSVKDLLVMDEGGMMMLPENRREGVFDDSKKEGLQRFVLYERGANSERIGVRNDVLYVIRKQHTTLSVFYLDLRNRWIDNNRFLMSITHYGFPQLRELYLRHMSYILLRRLAV